MIKKQEKSDLLNSPILNIKGDKVLLVWNRWYRNLWDELILLWNVKLLLNQWKKVTIACYDSDRLRKFFTQFIDVGKIKFIPELPKWFRSFFNYIFRCWMKWFTKFWKTNSIVLWWWEILTEENPWAYRYRRMSIRPFLLKKKFENLFKKRKKSDLYIMWWVQIPQYNHKKSQLLSLLKNTTACYLRDFDAVDEIKPYVKNCEFFMDTSYFAYEWDNVSVDEENKIEKPNSLMNSFKISNLILTKAIAFIMPLSQKEITFIIMIYNMHSVWKKLYEKM